MTNNLTPLQPINKENLTALTYTGKSTPQGASQLPVVHAEWNVNQTLWGKFVWDSKGMTSLTKT